MVKPTKETKDELMKQLEVLERDFSNIQEAINLDKKALEHYSSNRLKKIMNNNKIKFAEEQLIRDETKKKK